MKGSITSLAERAANDRSYLAYAMRVYQRAAGLPASGLMNLLGCGPQTLQHLALCPQPGRNGSDFFRDVDGLAKQYGVKRDQLAIVACYASAGHQMPEGRFREFVLHVTTLEERLEVLRETPDDYSAPSKGEDGKPAA